MKKYILLLISVVLIGFIFFFLVFSPLPQITNVNIPAGSTATQVAEILHKKNVILSKEFFIFILNSQNAGNKIKSGVYRFKPMSSIFQIIDDLLEGRVFAIKITIPEGFTARDIAQLLTEKKVADAIRFMDLVKKNRLEGFLFPETYFLEAGMGEEKIVELMVKQFQKEFTPEMFAETKKLGFNLNQIITLASIIEKEAKDDTERPLVSAVFHNRLKKRWYLESCATVMYALGEHKEKLNYTDLKVESPYNTYRYYGLPPTPICSPGLNSINAALHPTKTDAMFFVVDKKNGTHKFSRYYLDHLKSQDGRVLRKTKQKIQQNPKRYLR